MKPAPPSSVAAGSLHRSKLGVYPTMFTQYDDLFNETNSRHSTKINITDESNTDGHGNGFKY